MVVSSKVRKIILSSMLSLIMLVGGFLALYFTVIKPSYKSDALNSTNTAGTDYENIGELLNDPTTATGDTPFDGAVLTTLIKKIKSSCTTVSDLAGQVTNTTAITASNIRTQNGKSLVVRLGGLDWIVTYVTKDSTNSNVIATLWLSNNHQSAWGTTSKNLGDHYGFTNGGLYSDWSDDWRNSTVGTYPSNMYGTSYIRVETLNNPNNRKYATSNSATTSGTSIKTTTSAHPFALYTYSGLGLTTYLTTPNRMSWMSGKSAKTQFGWSYDLPNDSLTGTGGYYSGYDYSSTSANSTRAAAYDDWGGDYLWLPSLTETGYSGDSHGLWALNNAERSTYDGSTTTISSSTIGTTQSNYAGTAYVYSWSRSAYSDFALSSYNLDPSGGGCFDYSVNYSRAVRPALLLNLTSAASHAAKAEAIITVDSNGGTWGTTEVSVAVGDAWPTLISTDGTLPAKSGYVFGGFTLVAGDGDSGDLVYDANGSVTSAYASKTVDENVTIKAVWTPITCTLTLNHQSGTSTTATVTSTYSATLGAVPPPTRAGCTFVGYFTQTGGGGRKIYDSSGTSVIGASDFTENTTLYAYWTANTYNITINNNSGSGPSSTTYTFSESSQTKTISNPTRSEYSFSGWTISCSGFNPTISGTTLTIPANCYGDITLTANWIPYRTITVAGSISDVAYMLTGGGAYAEGTTVTLKAIPKIGYGMKYWLKNGEPFSGNDAYEITVTVDGDATYTAVFTELGVNIDEFVVASTKGGVAYVVGQDVSELDDDDTVTIMTKTCLVGYEFVGWYLDNDRTTLISDNPSYRVAKSVAYKHVLVAVYREVTGSNVNTEVKN